jgi:hypothetical protein
MPMIAPQARTRPPPSRTYGAIHLPRFAGEDEGALGFPLILPWEGGEVADRVAD